MTSAVVGGHQGFWGRRAIYFQRAREQAKKFGLTDQECLGKHFYGTGEKGHVSSRFPSGIYATAVCAAFNEVHFFFISFRKSRLLFPKQPLPGHICRCLFKRVSLLEVTLNFFVYTLLHRKLDPTSGQCSPKISGPKIRTRNKSKIVSNI